VVAVVVVTAAVVAGEADVDVEPDPDPVVVVTTGPLAVPPSSEPTATAAAMAPPNSSTIRASSRFRHRAVSSVRTLNSVSFASG
jgi:hypothetical protein